MSFISRLLQRTPPQARPRLFFHNTLSGALEEFSPRIKGKVSLYSCGPTVYEYQHIGNLRPYVFADTLKRVLELGGYRVAQVINITDVGHLTSDADEGEDKLEKIAKEKGERVSSIAARVTDAYYKDLDALGIKRSSITFTKATDFIPEQIALIKTLEQKGYTYQTGDGIYFDTSRFKDYGKLGNIDLAGLKQGVRVELGEKKHPTDFALWKFSPKNERRQQEWKSPWGVGFPGWHLECTAMVFARLGKQIDIHTGGVDHIGVHHQNEIAQAEAVTGKRFVKYWLHNAFITIEGKKISKSLGNTVYLSQLMDKGVSPRALRYLYLTAHYRSPLNFTWESIAAADATLKRLMRIYHEELPPASVPDPVFVREYSEALGNDLDTPKALSLVWNMLKQSTIPPATKKASLAYADTLFGLGLTEQRHAYRISIKKETLPPEVQELFRAREEARKKKDFASADEARDKLRALGYIIEDTRDGPVLSKLAP